MKLRAPSDQELVRQIALGDRAAETALHRRFWRPLVRYAGSLLKRSEHDAEDVAQDALTRAIAAIRAGDAPAQLRPWLLRITRNRAIDEVRRARWGEASLDDETSGAVSPTASMTHDPPAAAQRREALNELVSDLADLPVSQRNALLTRVVDGASPQETATRLGVSVEAAQMLVTRGRATLRSRRDARLTEGDLDRQLRVLAPPVGLLTAGGFTAKLAAFGGAKLAATAAVAVAGLAVVAGGAELLRSDTRGPGQPSVVSIASAPSISRVGRNGPLPPGVATVTAKVHLPMATPGHHGEPKVTLHCPAGMRFSSLIITQPRYLHTGYGLVGDPYGHPREATTIRFGTPKVPNSRGTVGIVCRHHDTQAALTTEVAALRPVSAAPGLKGPIIVEATPSDIAGTTVKRGQLFITLRLDQEARRAVGGWALWVQIGGLPLVRLVDADQSTASGHCYQAEPIGLVRSITKGRAASVRLWIGDGHGGAVQVRQTLRVQPATGGGDPHRHIPTWRLGCYSPHL